MARASYSKGIIQHTITSLGLKGRGRPGPRQPLPVMRPSSSSWAGLAPEERRKRWWYDKMEWFGEQDRARGKPVKSDADYARAVSRMWNIQREEKRIGVLGGTHDYTGKGLAEGKDY